MAAAYVKIYVNKMDDYHLVRTYGGNERDVKHMAYNYANFTVEEFIKKHPFYTDECKDCFKLILVYVKKRSSKTVTIETPITMNQAKWLIGNNATTFSNGSMPIMYNIKNDKQVIVKTEYRMIISGTDSNGNRINRSYAIKDTNSDTISKVINNFMKEYNVDCTYNDIFKMDIIMVNGNTIIRYKDDFYIFNYGTGTMLIDSRKYFTKVITSFDSVEDAISWIDNI